MNKKSWILLAISAAVMLLPPLMVTFTPKENFGVGVVFPLFFIIDPLWSAILGILSERRFWLPLLNAALFVVGTWCFFEFGESAFLLYASFYLAIGWLMQSVILLIRKLIRKNAEPKRISNS